MDSFVNKLCKAYFHDHPDMMVHGADATFVGFVCLTENADIPLGAANLRYTFRHGRIDYRLGGEGLLSGRLLLKYSNSLQQPMGAPDGFASFAREVAFFRQLLPTLRLHKRLASVPKLCASRVTATDSTNQKVLLFECPEGSMDFACRTYLGHPHLSLMVRHIANVHVAYWLARRANPSFWPEEKHLHQPYSQPQRVLPLLNRCFQHIAAVAHSAVAHVRGKERLRQMLDQFEERLQAPFSLSSRNGCWTMCHQSYGQNNVVFEHYRGKATDMRIFNWQSMGFASLGVDLVIMLFVEQKIGRGQAVPQLVKEYQKALREIPVAERPTVEAINAEIKRCVPVALYVLAYRVQRASSRILPDRSVYPAGHWNVELIMNLLRYLITTDFV